MHGPMLNSSMRVFSGTGRTDETRCDQSESPAKPTVDGSIEMVKRSGSE